MKTKFWLTVLAASSVGLGALAHSDATGVVKDRMDGMDKMGEAMKRLTPMMRGQSDFDPDIVRSAADTMINHAGSRMTELFPEGSNGKPSEALDLIWVDWDEFAALAQALQTSAEGMKQAAGNGLAVPGDVPGNAMMGSGQTMMGGNQSMMGGASAQMMSTEMLAQMPVNAGFMAVTQTCSACHQKFRAEDN